MHVDVHGEQNGASSTIDFAASPSGSASLSGSVALPRGFVPSCVVLTVVVADGTTSAPIEACEADKCTLHAEPTTFPSVDWESVPEGCHADCTERCGRIHLRVP